MKYIKSASRLLNRVCVGQQGLDPSKEVLWVSVCQKAAELPGGKVGGLKKNSAMRPSAGVPVSNPAAWQNFFFKPPTLPAGNLAALLTYRDPQYLFRKI